MFDAKTGELPGAHRVGAEGAELIQGYVIGRQFETACCVIGDQSGSSNQK